MILPPPLHALLVSADWQAALAWLDSDMSGMEYPAARAFVLRAMDREVEAFDVLRDALASSGRESGCAGLFREWMLADGRMADLDRLLPPTATADGAIEDRILAAVDRHRRGDLRGALNHCEQVLGTNPRHPAALAHRARTLHNLGMRDEALASFEAAITEEPLYAEGWFYRGIARRATGDMAAAVDSFSRASHLRPAYRAARWNLAKTLLVMGRLDDAHEALESLYARFPDDAGIATDLGFAQHRLKRANEARQTLSVAASLDPHNGLARLYLGMVCSELGDRDAADAALQAAVSLLRRDPEVWAELATFYENTNQIAKLQSAITHGLEVAPSDPRLLLEAARLARRTQRHEEALHVLRRLDLARLHPRQQRAYWYEAGRNFDRCDRFEESWHAFSEANLLARREMQAELAGSPPVTDLLEHLRARPTAVANTIAQEHDGRSPVFLLGFPRSGITLLTTMLAGHPRIVTLEEQPTIESCVDHLVTAPLGYPGSISQLNANECEALREMYWRVAASRAADPDGGKVLVDAFPLRTIHVKLIRRAFPAARIVFVLRHPGDVVLSNFMQDYATNAANLQFTDLLATARIYAMTMEIWDGSGAAASGNTHSIRYEDLVRDPQTVLGGVLAFLKLPWDPRVMMYQQRARALRVGTSSYHQVAEPIYSRSIGRWIGYRSHMADVLPLLRPRALAMRYSFDPGPP